jgi:hypothetical protein
MGTQFRARMTNSRPEQRSLAWAFMEIKSTDSRVGFQILTTVLAYSQM